MPLDQNPPDGGNKPSLRRMVMLIAQAIAKIAVGAIIRSEADAALRDITEGINELFEDLEVTKEAEEEDDTDQ